MAAVFGWGHEIHNDKRVYLHKLAMALGAGEIHAVIASGGHTSRKNNPGVSEAAVIYGYLYAEMLEQNCRLVPRFRAGESFSLEDLERINEISKGYSQERESAMREIDFFVEPRARTTRENIFFMRELFEERGVWKDYRLVAYCCATHQIKICALAYFVWGYVPSSVTYAGLRKVWLKQLLLTLPSVLALWSRTLRRLEDERRERQMEEK